MNRHRIRISLIASGVIKEAIMRNWLRNLTYASVIVASLAATLHYLNRPTLAEITGSLPPGVVAAEDGRILMNNSKVYQLGGLGYVEETYVSPIPIPASQVAYFGGLWLIDTDGNGWQWNGSWDNRGPVPEGNPIPVHPSTWGEVKVTAGR